MDVKTMITNDNIKEFVERYINNRDTLPLDLQVNINDWDVSEVTNMSYLFKDYFSFDEQLNDWVVNKVQIMTGMFSGCASFNQPLDQWNVSSVHNMDEMFMGCVRFNQPLNSWGDKISQVSHMSKMFHSCLAFNQDLDEWDVSNVITVYEMFKGCTEFNGSLNRWGPKTAKMTDMTGMFNLCFAFNQPLDEWNVHSVQAMDSMFYNCISFDSALDGWGEGTQNVKSMYAMFENCRTFNQPLNQWNVIKVTTMNNMFSKCSSFNQPLNQWNVKNVSEMEYMFYGCGNFDQPLTSWTSDYLVEHEEMFAYCPISEENMPNFDYGDVRQEHLEYINNFLRKFQHPKYKMNICDAIHCYTNIIDFYVNSLFREPPIRLPNPLFQQFLFSIVDVLDDYFANHAPRITKEMIASGQNITFRGEQALCANGECRNGVVMSYTSTSLRIDVLQKFIDPYIKCCLYEYILEEGMPYIIVDHILDKDGFKCQYYGEEYEMLLPRGIRLHSPKELRPRARISEQRIRMFQLRVGAPVLGKRQEREKELPLGGRRKSLKLKTKNHKCKYHKCKTKKRRT